MNTHKTIEVVNFDEFESLFINKDFRVSKAIVEEILNNIHNTKEEIMALSISVLDTEEIYDITIKRQHFADALKENLTYYEKEEEYLGCKKITEAIKYLQEN
jgi:hypothetical protein